MTAQIIAMREFPSCVTGTGNPEGWTLSVGDSMERSRGLELSADRVYKGERYIEIKLQKRTSPNNHYGSDQANEEMTRPWQKKHLKELLVRVPSANSGPVIVPVPIS